LAGAMGLCPAMKSEGEPAAGPPVKGKR
jgi:hypothetical protein